MAYNGHLPGCARHLLRPPPREAEITTNNQVLDRAGDKYLACSRERRYLGADVNGETADTVGALFEAAGLRHIETKAMSPPTSVLVAVPK